MTKQRMTPKRAADIVAREAIHKAITDLHPEWEEFADIGEYDWENVEKRIGVQLLILAKLVKPPTDDFDAAYAYFIRRAEKESA